MKWGWYWTTGTSASRHFSFQQPCLSTSVPPVCSFWTYVVPCTRSPVRWRVFDPREHHRPDQLADSEFPAVRFILSVGKEWKGIFIRA